MFKKLTKKGTNYITRWLIHLHFDTNTYNTIQKKIKINNQIVEKGIRKSDKRLFNLIMQYKRKSETR